MLSVTQPVATDPCPAPFNLASYVLQHAARLCHKTALITLTDNQSETWSYAQLESAVLGIATGFLQSGLQSGDRVILRLGNSVDFPLAYLGAIAAGLVPVPTSSQLTECEVAGIIETIRPAAIVRSEGVACPETHCPMINTAQLRLMRDLPAAAYAMGDPDRPAYIVFTSGTSGIPRAVVHAHRAIWARRMMHDGWYGIKESDRVLHAGAFNWTYTLGTGLMDPWSIGATALIAAEGTPPTSLPSLMNTHHVSLFAAAPGVYRKLMNTGDRFDLPNLRHGLSAGEKLSELLRSKWQSTTGTALYEAYGMSECSTFISSSPSAAAPPETLGFPQPGRHVAVLGPDGPVQQGEEGTIAIHRSDLGMMIGYLNAEEETKSRMQDGWFLTGDQGIMHSDGSIRYIGRSDDIMNAGGYRVSPLEVEAVLSTVPGLTEVAVTDIEVKPDVRVIMAFYTSQTPLADDALNTYVRTRLAGYKCPRGFFRVDVLPTGANGKLLRRALRPIYEALHGQA